MKLTRRDAIKTFTAACCSQAIRQAFGPSLLLAENTNCTGGAGNVFVHVYLRGGHDGLYMFPLLEQTRYNALSSRRSSIMLNRSAIQNFGESLYGLHPLWSNRAAGSSTSVFDLMAAGKGRIISCVGMPNDRRSHPEAETNLLAGTDVFNQSSGAQWLARAMDQCGFVGSDVFRLGVTPGLPLTRPIGKELPITIDQSLHQYDLDTQELRRAAATLDQILDLQRNLPNHGTQLVQGMHGMLSSIPVVRPLAAESVSGSYVAGSANFFADAARIIKYKMRTAPNSKVIIQIGLDGFDHHTEITTKLPALMGEISKNISAMWSDLSDYSRQRTAVFFASEFGRSFTGYVGSEHGYGNVSLLLSEGLRSGANAVVGEPPTLAELNFPDPNPEGGVFAVMPAKVDYRQVYAEILEWMGIESVPVFPGFNSRASRLNLFSSSATN